MVNSYNGIPYINDNKCATTTPDINDTNTMLNKRHQTSDEVLRDSICIKSKAQQNQSVASAGRTVVGG